MRAMNSGWMCRTSARVLLVAALGLSGTACTETHASPQEGTETGNPPVLDSSLISLVVGANSTHIVGQKGAVTPGGSRVEITSVLTGKVFRGESNADGSFDIVVDTGEYDTFDVRAAIGKYMSQVVLVDRGGARIGDNNQSLSCEELRQDALDQVSIAASMADKACTTDSDCSWKETATDCSDDCGRWIVSAAGAQYISEAVHVANKQTCATFTSKGCTVTHPPCAPSVGTLACIGGQCQVPSTGSPSMPGGADCTSSFEAGPGTALLQVYWFYPQGQVCLPRNYGGLGGNGNRYATRADCESSCLTEPTGDCPPNRVRVDACIKGGLAGGCAETRIACPKVCSSYSDCAGDPIGTWCTSGGFCDATSPE